MGLWGNSRDSGDGDGTKPVDDRRVWVCDTIEMMLVMAMVHGTWPWQVMRMGMALNQSMRERDGFVA